jgi:ATP-dependent DNA ligase
LQNGAVRFVSRNRRNLTARFPSLQDIAKSIRAVSAVLDGEIVALDKSLTTERSGGLAMKRDFERFLEAYTDYSSHFKKTARKVMG